MQITTYQEALDYINSLNPSSRKDYLSIGLERMKSFLNLLDNPQNKFKSIHVAGTAGKGSTSSILSHILVESGYKTGLHLSPHLEDIRERMQINNKLIEEEKFVKLVNQIIPAVEKINPSYFETLTALAFLHFVNEKVDYAVIEVGLGGTLDATNIIKPDSTILTNVDLDHTEILGKTIEKIAKDKVGIIKNNIPVITAINQPSIISIVSEKAKETNSSLLLLDKDFSYKIKESNLKGSIFNLKIKNKKLKDLFIKSPGEYQVLNASVAISCLLNLNLEKVNEKNIRKALEDFKMPARFEIINSIPLTILDGAHSPIKMQTFLSSLTHLFPDRKITFILALKKGKDIENIVEPINRLAKKVYITTFGMNTDFGKQHSYTPKEIAQFIKTDYELITNPLEALKQSIKESNSQDIICITGSLYLAGELRKQITKMSRGSDLLRSHLLLDPHSELK